MAKRVTKEIKQFFASEPRHLFEKVAGQGGSGIALCFRDAEAGPNEFPRFIVKTVVLGNNIEITNEIKWLKVHSQQAYSLGVVLTTIQVLQWAEHIVTLINLDPDPLRNLFQKPYFIIEYVENGTLNEFLNRRRDAGLRRLPNRVLWAIFLCLIRACMAMAYPPPPNPKTPGNKRRETLPVDVNAEAAGNLIHTDMNLGNLMFGDRVKNSEPPQPPDTSEHLLIPILKLIDFGEAYEVTTPEALPKRREYDRKLNLAARMQNDLNKLQNMGISSNDGRENFRSIGTDMNILEIGVVMSRLVTNDFTGSRVGVLRELMSELDDEMTTNPDPTLDPELFWLAARCLACNPNLRPRLSQLHDFVEYYTENRKYKNIIQESDNSITNMIERHIFDVDGARLPSNIITPSPGSGGHGGAAGNPAIALGSGSSDASSSISNPTVISPGGSPLLGTANNPIVIDVSTYEDSIFTASASAMMGIESIMVDNYKIAVCNKEYLGGIGRVYDTPK
ncbi:hypothetical protein F4859DRAFT_516173 [Xylaria cf. heliscus]|nr:hypothetical protein F4859DRAFT_516173 [Xylaria cf. heliscus]